jgi:hypothetical protein
MIAPAALPAPRRRDPRRRPLREEIDVAHEHRSGARQLEHARAYAQRRGWTVADEHVYADDEVSGAEFERRPG